MILTDASPVAVAENLSLRKISTVDRNDFETIRVRDNHRNIAFQILS